MKTAELRDKMVARVQETFAQYRTFNDVPVFKGTVYANAVTVKAPMDEPAYVTALHEFFAINPDKIQLAGRTGDKLIAG
jgi:hypothetical protein